jgi:hypothetical protein
MVEWLLVGGSGQIIAVAGTLEQNRKTVSELFFNLPSFCLFDCGCVLISRMIRQQLFVGPWCWSTNANEVHKSVLFLLLLIRYWKLLN